MKRSDRSGRGAVTELRAPKVYDTGGGAVSGHLILSTATTNPIGAKALRRPCAVARPELRLMTVEVPVEYGRHRA